MKTFSLNTFVLIVTTVLAFAFILPEKETVTYAVDIQQSEITWKGKK